MLAVLPGSLAAAGVEARKSKPLPRVGEFFRFADPATEIPVVRLTNPATASLLPAPTNAFISVKERFLVFSSDRTGRGAPFRLDLRTGSLSQIVPAAELLPLSLCLDPQQRFLYYIDGSTLKEVNLSSKKVQAIKDDVSAFSISSSGSDLVLVRRGRLERLNDGEKPLAEDVASQCLIRPGGSGCLFDRASAENREFWYVPLNADLGADPRLLAKGWISDPFWSPDGQSLLFLRDVRTDDAVLSEIREVSPETGLEQKVAPTSQFAAFAPNRNGSVFVGASRSKAQPTVILLLRSVTREFTLCEHRASHPASVSPVFSPDSRRVYFQSDHEGKSALYSVNVELVVDPT